VGLGLWNNPTATVAVETLLFAAAVWLYVRATRAADRKGRFGLWGLVLFLSGVYVANLVSPPPPSTLAVSVSALALWLVVLFAAWVDRHRISVASPATAGPYTNSTN
jgi:hypothetical protein